jgi:hypothetical protein
MFNSEWERAWEPNPSRCKKKKDFYCSFIWVWNLVSDINGIIKNEGIWEQGAEENILAEGRWNDRGLEKTA